MGYRLWDLESRKVIRRNNVYFNEAKFDAKPKKTEEVGRVVFREDGPSTSSSRQHELAQDELAMAREE